MDPGFSLLPPQSLRHSLPTVLISEDVHFLAALLAVERLVMGLFRLRTLLPPCLPLQLHPLIPASPILLQGKTATEELFTPSCPLHPADVHDACVVVASNDS